MDNEESEEAEKQSSVTAEMIKEPKKKSTLMPYLLIILGIVILGALAYSYWQYKSNDGLNLFGHKYGGKTVVATATTTTATTGTTATNCAKEGEDTYSRAMDYATPRSVVLD